MIYELSELTDKAAEYFSKHRGELVLDQVSVLSDKAADIISVHEGIVRMFNLKSISPKAWEILRKKKNFVLTEKEIRLKGSRYGYINN